MTPEDFNNPPHLPPCQAIVEFKVSPCLECGTHVWFPLHAPTGKWVCGQGHIVSVGTELSFVCIRNLRHDFVFTKDLYTSEAEAVAEVARRNGS